MLIQFSCDDGTRTRAAWPSKALEMWLMRFVPDNVPEHLEPFQVYVANEHVPSEKDPLFVTLVHAAIERRWNRSPPFDIVSRIQEETNGGLAFQNQCLQILHWLCLNADITELKISGEL